VSLQSDNELVAAFEAAFDRRDKVAAFKAVSALMDDAQANADLAAASTAIDSNLRTVGQLRELEKAGESMAVCFRLRLADDRLLETERAALDTWNEARNAMYPEAANEWSS
jgi:hypothetical protein